MQGCTGDPTAQNQTNSEKYYLFLNECFPLVSSESGNASWEIPQVTLKDEGFYECIAISSAGTGRAHTFLDVSGNHTRILSCSLSF